MDEMYWAEVIRNMRQGYCVDIAHDLAFNALRLHEHFEAIEHQRRNETA